MDDLKKEILKNYLWSAYCCGRADNKYIPLEVIDSLIKELESKGILK